MYIFLPYEQTDGDVGYIKCAIVQLEAYEHIVWATHKWQHNLLQL